MFYTYNDSFLSRFFTEFAELLSIEGKEVYVFSFKSKNFYQRKNGVDIYIKKRGGYILNYYNIYNIIKSTKPNLIISNFSYVNPALFSGFITGVGSNVVWFHTLKDQLDTSNIKIFIKAIFLKINRTNM